VDYQSAQGSVSGNIERAISIQVGIQNAAAIPRTLAPSEFKREPAGRQWSPEELQRSGGTR